MSSYVNSLQSMIQRDPKYAVRGPVLQSQQFVERFQQNMIVLECECMHGARADGGFGYFVSVENERNTNKSRLRVMVPAEMSALDAITLTGSHAGTYYQLATDVYYLLSSEETKVISNTGSAWVLKVNDVTVATSIDNPADPWDATWPAFDISGTLVPDAVGTYYYVDDLNGKPRYTQTGVYDATPAAADWVVYWNGTFWVIAYSPGSGTPHSTMWAKDEDVATPDLVSSWTATSGSGTVTVSAGLVTSATQVADAATPQFRERVTHVRNLNEFICEANISRQIVVPGTAPDSGTNIWESRVEPFDEWHEEKITTTVVELNTLTSDVWDPELHQFVESSRVLTQTEGSPSTTIDASTVTHVWYEEVACGWWLQITDTFSTSLRSYFDSENFYWPPVAQNADSVTAGQDEFFEPVEHVDGYFIKYCVGLKVKEAHNDVCKVQISESFALSVSTGDIVNTYMFPEAINHDGLIQDFKLSPTLHTAFSMSESIGTHPAIDTPTVRACTYNATSPTDWPSTITRTFARPYRGGYIVTTKTFYKPS